MIIGRQGNLALDLADPGPGILYANKCDLEGTIEDRLMETFRRCLALTAALTGEAEYPSDLSPRPGFWELSFNDRLNTPNTEETDRALRPAIESTMERLLGSGHTLIREADPKRRYGFVIHAEGVSSLDTIASKLQVDSSTDTGEQMINRRRFIVSTVLGSAGFAAGCAAGEPETGSPQDTAPVPPFQLDEFTVTELGEQMASGEMTSGSITELYLNRIADLDTAGPELRSMIETNPEALTIADRLDQERATTGPRSPLHGIPIVLKDNIDTSDQMTTAAGSLALAGSTPLQDSYVAEQLRAAGAVILGKANLSEWANFRSRDSSSGWSGRGGQCRNPYVLDHKPMRVKLWLGRRCLRKSGPPGHRHRDKRLDRLPGFQKRNRRRQTNGRTGQPFRNHPDLRDPGHRRTDDPNRDPMLPCSWARSPASIRVIRPRVRATGVPRPITRSFSTPGASTGPVSA